MFSYSVSLLIITFILNERLSLCQTKSKKCGQAVPTNVGLILDSSGSMKDEWSRVKTIAADFVATLQSEPHTAELLRFGVINFSNIAVIYRTFEQSVTPDEVKQIPLLGLTTVTNLALDAMKKLLDDAAASRDIVLVLTDGQSFSPNQTRISAAELKKIDGIEVYAVGIAEAVKEELDAIATSSDHVFTTSIDGLNQRFQAIAAEIAPCTQQAKIKACLPLILLAALLGAVLGALLLLSLLYLCRLCSTPTRRTKSSHEVIKVDPPPPVPAQKAPQRFAAYSHFEDG